MSKFFIDTEFLEVTQTKRFLGIPVGQTKPCIDLISIGIVSEDNREYYAVSKDFNLKEAWDRYDLKKEYPDDTEEGAVSRKVYWIREHVLKPIWKELYKKQLGIVPQFKLYRGELDHLFTYRNLKTLINKHGKSNKQIAEEIKEFVLFLKYTSGERVLMVEHCPVFDKPVEFYGYYADYDHVALSWLFGKMNELPKGFPKYTRDLKQMLDEKTTLKRSTWGDIADNFDMLNHIQTLPEFPQNKGAHNALEDARWNKKLYEFLQRL